MRFIFSAVLAIFFANQASAQCSVELGPDTTVCGTSVVITALSTGQSGPDSLQITYDASQGVTGLIGSPKVYFHSGVQTEPFGPWEYEVGTWGMDNGIGEMTNIGIDLWQITIHVESYYGYPGGTTVNGLWMVFRNADGTLTGKDDFDQDIFLYTSNGNTCDFSGVTGTDIPGGTGTYQWTGGSTGSSLSVTQTGNYSVTYTDGTGCVATDDINVTLTNGSAVVDLGPDTTICDGGIITLDAGSGFSSYQWSTSETPQTIEVGLSGDYTITVTDQNGCQGLDLIHVEIGNTSVAEYSYAPTSGLTVEFTDESTDANSIEWDLDGNGTYEQTTGPGATVQHTYTSEGVFPARMIAIGDCGNDTVAHNVLVQDVGIEDFENNPLKIYPNPSSGMIRVNLEGNTGNLLEVAVLDRAGRLVHSSEIQSPSGLLNLEGLDKGVYLLQARFNQKTLRQRIILH